MGIATHTASNKWSDRYKKCKMLHSKTCFFLFFFSFPFFAILYRFINGCLCSRGLTLSLLHFVSLSFLICCQSFGNSCFLRYNRFKNGRCIQTQILMSICHPGSVFFVCLLVFLFFCSSVCPCPSVC